MTSSMRSRVVRKTGPLVVGIICLGLTACTSQDPNLPSLGDTNTRPVSTGLEVVAQAQADCMSAAGIPAAVIDNPQGDPTRVVPSGDHVVMMYADGIGVSWNGNKVTGDVRPPTEDQKKSMMNLGTQGSTNPFLIIDGIDHSEAFIACLNETGYSDIAAQSVMSQNRLDPATIARQVEANNIWAACVRQNGWPEVEDSVMPLDLETVEWPVVRLPSTITETQLRQLLAACPNFDPEQMEKLQEYQRTESDPTRWPDDYLPEPSIQIDPPEGLTVPNGQATTEPLTPEQQAALDDYYRLTSVPSNAARDYYDAQASASPSPGER